MTKRNSRARGASIQRQIPATMGLENLEQRRMLSTTAPSYLVPTAPGVEITPILTVGESPTDGSGYRMVGIPDGLGAYDNGDGTFTVLMNHELGSTSGIVRDHGSRGAFVSKWVIDKETFEVLEGDDLIKSVQVWDTATSSYVSMTTVFNRFCSADLPDVGAFYNPDTELGTTERIFMNGEETDGGRAFGTVVSTGTAYQLPRLGRFAWENSVASPYAQDKTIVMGLDDSDRTFTTEGSLDPSEVYVYVGTKQSTGSEVDKAGLTNGLLYGMRVGLPGSYDANESTVTSGERFELVNLGDVSNQTALQIQNASVSNTITQFRRVEDGHFDPTDPNVFFFVTTDLFGGSTRLWKLKFDDITDPTAGGTIEIAIDSPVAVLGEMFDNMTVNSNGDVLLQEDVGNNAHLGKILQYDATSGDLFEIARHNGSLFLDTNPGMSGVQPAVDPAPNIPGPQGTQDEESSGIIDLSAILGPGYYLTDVQAHFGISDTELVQGGQLLIINTNAAAASLEDGIVSIQGTVNDDSIAVTRQGNDISVWFNGEVLESFAKHDVEGIILLGHAGDDSLQIASDVQASGLLVGGLGSDALSGGSNEDILIGDSASLGLPALSDVLQTWLGGGNFASRVASLSDTFDGAIVEDGSVDQIAGNGSKDWFFDSGNNDDLLDLIASDVLN